MIESTFGWIALFIPEKGVYVCSICQSHLEKIEGETCKICGRPFTHLNNQFRHGEVCLDCFRWEEDPEYKGILTKNISLFVYNDFLKEILAKFKYRGDYALAKIFHEKLRKTIKELQPMTIIPIPLSEERLFERGFNQAEALVVEAGFTAANILSRVHSEKQSKKSRIERIHLPQVFRATQTVNGKILLIDDIYTTGSTLRHAAKVLKTAGAEEVYSITIARG